MLPADLGHGEGLHIDRQGDAEVRHDRVPPFAQKHIGRLDVPMYYAAPA